MAASFGQPFDAKQRRQGRGQRADGRRQRADQAVAGKDRGAVAVGGLFGQQRMLQRNQHAEIAAGRIDAADEGDQQDRRESFCRRKNQAGEDDQSGAGEKQVSQFKARCDEARDQGQSGRSQQRSAGDDADLLRAKADHREVDRQDDDRKAVAEPAQASRSVKTGNVGARH